MILVRLYVLHVSCTVRRDHMYYSPRSYASFAEIICIIRRDHVYQVPILKFTEEQSKVNIDLSINKSNGLVNCQETKNIDSIGFHEATRRVHVHKLSATCTYDLGDLYISYG